MWCKAPFAEGAKGYVVKTDARRELLTAVDAVLRGEQFIGRRFSGHDFAGASDARVSERDPSTGDFAPLQQKVEIVRCHEVGFYSEGTRLLDDLTQFVKAALKPGMRLSLSRSGHTGIAFFQGCRQMAWILLLRSSRGDTSGWTLLTRCRRSRSVACQIQFDF